MGKSFWPLLLIVAALGAAAVWTQTPRFAVSLPEGVRDSCRACVRLVRGLPDRLQPVRHDEPVVLLGGTTAVPSEQAETVAPARPAAAVSAAPAAEPVAVPTVKKATVAQADWCVLAEMTPVQSLDDKPLSVAQGGRFFLIERRARAPVGTLLIGNFTPKRLPHTVQVNSRHVLCLTGSPDDLTAGQLHALKMYYQLRGEAREYLAEVVKSGGDTASPVWKQLQEAVRIRDFRTKELRGMTTLKGEQRATEEAELAKLDRKVEDLQNRHENWKRAHRGQIDDPTTDPHYQVLVREYRNYVSALPAGLALD